MLFLPNGVDLPLLAESLRDECQINAGRGANPAPTSSRWQSACLGFIAEPKRIKLV
jgi:hypothetical protein